MSSRPTLPDYDHALQAALRIVMQTERTESVALNDAVGHVLREPVTADRDLPPFNRAQMDGYAVRASDITAGCALPVAATVSAGSSPDITVPAGACVKIATGAAVPTSLDTVIQHELSDRKNPVRFTIDSVKKTSAIHPQGIDAKCSDVLIQPGTQLSAHHIGIAAIVGRAHLQCAAPPTAIVISSGDEVLPIGQPLLDYQIHNSNGPMVTHLLRNMGANPTSAQLVPDDRQQTINTIAAAIDTHDLIITIGGISAGERDHFPAAFDSVNIEYALRGAAIQPGKPVIVGKAPNGAIIIGLPGNPVSSLVCACLFIWPIIRTILGNTDTGSKSNPLPWRGVTLAAPIKPNPKRRAFRPATLAADGNTITVPNWAGSGDLVHTAATHGITQLPVQNEQVAANTRLPFLPWPS